MAKMLESGDTIKEAHSKILDSVVNYMVIHFGYDGNICLPYKDGAELLAKLEKAENVERYYTSDGLKFNKKPLEFTFQIITQREYREGKMHCLLGVGESESS